MKRHALPLAALLLIQSSAVACLWDYDTLNDERRGLPGVSEIITGRWERHSPEFYRHRIEAMKKLLAEKPDDAAAWDNLAVAQEKVGDIDAAIATILDKDKRFPGQYTTEANLGTFYLHKGDFPNGITHIRRALAINPDAHFGREKYQLQVAEFLQNPPAADEDGAVGSFVVPMLEMKFGTTGPTTTSVADRMRIARMGRPSAASRAEIDSAVQGVIGMIRFGTGTSPHLYYALGDLLAARGDANLAYRAYLRAIEFNPPNAREVQAAADQAKGYVYYSGDLDATYAAERKAADAWVAAYQDYERKLLADGRDAEDEKNFADFYAANGSPRLPLPWFEWRKMTKERIFVACILPVLAMYVILRIRSGRRRRLDQSGETVTT